MATNSTQNETPAWVTPVALGLIILFFVVVLIFLAIRLLAREARRNDPQRKLIEHFFRQVAEVEKANKAARKMEKKVRWRGWSLDGLCFVGRSPPTSNEGMVLPTSNGNNRNRPVLPIIVEETSASASTAEAETELEDVDYGDFVVRWVPVPRGYRLPVKKTKKANALAEVVGALKGKN
ncbi:hypothetical protein N7524_005703 [Penicillium chrysogenum]|nr:hypothetical protein N7524_005703 [Penicillium chrysogenum]